MAHVLIRAPHFPSRFASVTRSSQGLAPAAAEQSAEAQAKVLDTPPAMRNAGPGQDCGITDWDTFIDSRLERGSDDLYADAVTETERKLLSRVLRHTHGNQAQASRILGITRASLRKKLRILRMNVHQLVAVAAN